MEPMIIDVAGTAGQFLKWALKRVLLLLGMVVFGLSAPVLFTFGMEILVWQGADLSIWAPAYFLLGPVASAIWMVFICHWRSVRQWRRAGKLDSWREDHGGIHCTVGKSIWFMVSGFFGSAIGEGVLIVTTFTIFPLGLTRESLMAFFAIAPLFVFAPVLLVLVSRQIRRDKYATV